MSKPAPRVPIKNNPGFWRRGSRVGFHYRDPNGNVRQATRATLTEAKALRATLETNVQKGTWREPAKDITLAAYVPEWAATYRGRRTAKVKPGTLHGYRRLLELHVIPVLGQTMVAAIETRDLKYLVNRLETKDISVGTIGNVIAAFKALLATAEEDGLRGPSPRSVPLGRPTADARPKHLEPEELEALFSKVPPEHALTVRLITYTGARIGEFTELRWKDLDLTSDPAVLSISRSRRNGRVDTPKSKYGVRRLPLNPELKKALAAHRLQSLWSKDDDPIFATRRNGNPHRGEDILRRILKPAALAAGLVDEEGKPWPGWHTLRHTCGTNLARAGRRPEEIATWLGHHAASFSLDTYVGRPSATKIEGVDLLATSDGAVTT